MTINPFRILLAFILASSAVAEEPPGVKVIVGKPAPDFAVTVADGTELKLSDFRGKSHLLVVFGRAHW